MPRFTTHYYASHYFQSARGSGVTRGPLCGARSALTEVVVYTRNESDVTCSECGMYLALAKLHLSMQRGCLQK